MSAMTPDQVQEFRERMIEHAAEVNSWFGEQWRRNERTDAVITKVEERANKTEDRVSSLERWQSNVVGKIGVVSFIAALLGTGVVTLVVRIATGKP